MVHIDRNLEVSIKGQHDVDKGWMNEVRTANGNTDPFPKIVPRFLFEGWQHGIIFVKMMSFIYSL